MHIDVSLRNLVIAYVEVTEVVEDLEKRPLKVDFALDRALRLRDIIFTVLSTLNANKTIMDVIPTTLSNCIMSLSEDVERIISQLRERNPNDYLGAPVADHLYVRSLELRHCIGSLICITNVYGKEVVICNDIISKLESDTQLTWQEIYDTIFKLQFHIQPLALKAEQGAAKEWEETKRIFEIIIEYINVNITKGTPPTLKDREALANQLRTLRGSIARLIGSLAERPSIPITPTPYRTVEAQPPRQRVISQPPALLNLEKKVLVRVDGREFEVKTPFIIGRHDERYELCIRSLGRYRVEDASIFSTTAQQLRMKTREFPPIICMGVRAGQQISRLQLLVFYRPGKGLSIIATGRRKMDIYYEDRESERHKKTAGYYSGEVVDVGRWARVKVMKLDPTIYIELLEEGSHAVGVTI